MLNTLKPLIKNAIRQEFASTKSSAATDVTAAAPTSSIAPCAAAPTPFIVHQAELDTMKNRMRIISSAVATDRKQKAAALAIQQKNRLEASVSIVRGCPTSTNLHLRAQAVAMF